MKGSLAAAHGGLRFRLLNTLATANLTGLRSLHVDGQAVPPERVRMRVGDRDVEVAAVSAGAPLVFPRNQEAEVTVQGAKVAGRAKVRLEAQSAEFGDLVIEFDDDVAAGAGA